MKKSVLAITLASLFSPVSYLQAQTTSSDETLVVTAHRFEQSINSTLAAVEVVTKEEIQAIQAKSLEEVLRRLPGIQISTNGGYGQQASVFIRGSESDHALVLINGVRMSSATTGSTAIGSIPLNGVERIEYIRGPRTALYGSDAIGGVINIITSFTGRETELWIEGGSDKYQKYAASTAHELGDNGWIKAAVSYEELDGFSATNSSYQFYTPDSQDDDGYKHTDWMLELGYHFTDQLSVKLNSNHSDGTAEYDNGEKDQELLSTSIVGSYKTEKLSSELIVATSQDKSSYAGSSSNYETNRWSVAWQNGYQVNQEWLVLGGIDWVNDDISETTGSYTETKRDNLGVYSSAVFAKDKVQAEASLRFDDNEQYGSHTTWQLGLGYELSSLLRVSAMSGSAFKAPTFNDLYYPGSGNPDLNPEESMNYEVALDITPEFADLRVALYQNDISDLITSVGSWPNNRYENVQDAKIQGLELSGSFNTGDFGHAVSFDITDTENEQTNKELARRAKYSAKWNTSYQWNDWQFDVSYLYRSKSYDNAANTTKLDAYSLVDVATHYYVTDNVIIRGKVANLFDEEYETASGYNAQQRSYYVGLNYKF